VTETRVHTDAAFEAEFGFCRLPCTFCDDLDKQDVANGYTPKPVGEIWAEVLDSITPEVEARLPRPQPTTRETP
jgi:hypothetical protein